jgi:DNA invertase Pin-like site-specific DNA recombinase
VSRDRTEQRISVDRQLGRCRKVAESEFPGIPVVEFVDNDVSGADPDAVRPGYNDMVLLIRSAKPDEVAGLVCNEQSRLTRQTRQWEELVITLTRAGIRRIHTVDKGPVSVEPGNRLVGSIMALIDAEEAARTRVRMLAGYEQLRAEGRPGGTKGAYGYRKGVGPDGRKTLEVVEEEAKAIRMLAGLVIEGHSLTSLAQRLNAGELVCAGKDETHWSAGSIRALLMRPSIAGLRSRTVPVRINPDGTPSKTTREEIVGKAKWKPIITAEYREQLLVALNRHSIVGTDGRPYVVKRNKPPQPRRWVLSDGILRCVCGAQVSVTSSSATNRLGNRRPFVPRQYRCERFHGGCGGVAVDHAELVERFVHSQLCQHLAREPEIAARLAGEPNAEVDSLYGEKAAAQADYDDAVELKGAGEISMAEFRRMRAQATERLERVDKLLADLPENDSGVPDVDTIKHHWEDLTIRRKQRALHHYIEVIQLKRSTRQKYPDHFARIAARLDITWRRPADED